MKIPNLWITDPEIPEIEEMHGVFCEEHGYCKAQI